MTRYLKSYVIKIDSACLLWGLPSVLGGTSPVLSFIDSEPGRNKLPKIKTFSLHFQFLNYSFLTSANKIKIYTHQSINQWRAPGGGALLIPVLTQLYGYFEDVLKMSSGCSAWTLTDVLVPTRRCSAPSLVWPRAPPDTAQNCYTNNSCARFISRPIKNVFYFWFNEMWLAVCGSAVALDWTESLQSHHDYQLRWCIDISITLRVLISNFFHNWIYELQNHTVQLFYYESVTYFLIYFCFWQLRASILV